MNRLEPENSQNSSAQPTGLVAQQNTCEHFPQDLLEITAPAVDALSRPPSIDRALTQNEAEDLESFEKVIRSGKETFEKVGLALVEIRDRRLYRREFSKFQEYCQQRWGWGRRQADRLISAAAVARTLRPLGLIVQNERQARELAALPPKQRTQALREALDQTEGKPVAKAIRQAAQKRFSPPAIKPQPPLTWDAQAAAAKREMEVAIEDLKIVLEKLDHSPPDTGVLTECADHLSETVKLLRKLARATPSQPESGPGGGMAERTEPSPGNVEVVAASQPVRDPQTASPAQAHAIGIQEPDGNSAKEPQTG